MKRAVATAFLVFASTMSAAADAVDVVGAEAVPAEAIKVEIAKMKYAPADLEIEAGSTVIWKNGDALPHNVQLATPVQVVGNMLRAGQSMALRFNEPGDYTYICTPHPFMKGKVTVKPKT